ncbi:MAG TPA: endonuclease domain-containing protein [Streptosporangiaceae bacterium]
MERQRQRGAAARPTRVYDPAAVQRWRATHRLKRYGLTQESFDILLGIQGHACAMCHEPFQDGDAIHIDHDHNLGCHPDEKRACDRCRRGLLCLRCNTALGYIEGYAELARAYVADPPARPGRL